jgi:uncharacterized membrane protein
MSSGELYAIAAAICWSMAAVFYKKGIGAAKATGLSAITPVLSSLIALVTLKEKSNMALIIGTVATIAGIWIIL